MARRAEEQGRSLRRILVLGTGRFAAGIANALAHDVIEAAQVHVAGRDPRAVRGVCAMAGAHAAAVGAPTVFRPHHLDAADDAGLRALLESVRPGAVVVCVSHQSPEESRGPSTAWSRLLGEAGFGITLPLQADLVLRVARACAETTPAALVNACFPDAVNGLIQAAGLPVLCGVGNIGTLAAATAATLAPEDRPRLRMLAHHVHLHAPEQPASEALAWLGDTPLTDLADRLAAVRSLPPFARNLLGAWSAAPVLRAAASRGRPWTGHVPGPLGLPGGFPVRIDGPQLTVLPPNGLGLDRAVAFNERLAALDGVTVTAGRARFTGPAYQALRERWPAAPHEFGPDEVGELCEELLDLRDRLRTTVPGG